MKKFLFLGVLLFCGTAFAKPINLHKQSKKEGFTANTSAAYERQSGNTNKTKIDIDAYTQYLKKNSYTISLAVEGNLTEIQGIDKQYSNTNNLVQARYRRFYSSFLGLETFIHREEDSNKNLTSSYIYAVGPYVRVFNSPFVLLDLGLLYAAEWEKHKLDGTEYAVRSYQYAAIGFHLPNQVLVGHTIQFEPKVTEVKDYRIYNTSTVQIKANKYITLGLDFDQSFDSRPATNVSERDIELKTRIGLTW